VSGAGVLSEGGGVYLRRREGGEDFGRGSWCVVWVGVGEREGGRWAVFGVSL
jgi:hypothetical protein